MSNFALYGSISAGTPDMVSSKPYKYYVTFESSTPLVDLETLKNALNISDDLDDSLLNLYLSSATSYAENFTMQEYVEKKFLTYRDYFDYSNLYCSPYTDYGNENFLLTKTNFFSLDNFQYLVNEVWTDIDTNLFYLIDQGDYKRIVLKRGMQWPNNKDDQLQSIKIEFTSNPTIVKNDIINAIMMIVADLYSDRGDCKCDNESFTKRYVSGAAKGILLQNRLIRI